MYTEHKAELKRLIPEHLFKALETQVKNELKHWRVHKSNDRRELRAAYRVDLAKKKSSSRPQESMYTKNVVYVVYGICPPLAL